MISINAKAPAKPSCQLIREWWEVRWRKPGEPECLVKRWGTVQPWFEANADAYRLRSDAVKAMKLCPNRYYVLVHVKRFRVNHARP